MSLDLLRQIAASRLPLTFHRPEDVDQVRLLRTAGLVIATVPALCDPLTLSGKSTVAQVLAMTQKGLEELAAFRYPSAPKDESKPWLSARIAALLSAQGSTPAIVRAPRRTKSGQYAAAACGQGDSVVNRCGVFAGFAPRMLSHDGRGGLALAIGH